MARKYTSYEKAYKMIKEFMESIEPGLIKVLETKIGEPIERMINMIARKYLDVSDNKIAELQSVLIDCRTCDEAVVNNVVALFQM